MPKTVKKPGLNAEDIILGRVYRVQVEDVVYKAVVVQVLPENMFRTTILEPIENEENATLELGNVRQLPASAFLEPYAYTDEDGTREDHLFEGLSHQAKVDIKLLGFYAGPMDDSGVDRGQYFYRFVLTDSQRLGKKSVVVDVNIPLEGLGRSGPWAFTDEVMPGERVDVSADCDYGLDTDDPSFDSQWRPSQSNIDAAKEL